MQLWDYLLVEVRSPYKIDAPKKDTADLQTTNI